MPRHWSEWSRRCDLGTFRLMKPTCSAASRKKPSSKHLPPIYFLTIKEFISIPLRILRLLCMFHLGSAAKLPNEFWRELWRRHCLPDFPVARATKGRRVPELRTAISQSYQGATPPLLLSL